MSCHLHLGNEGLDLSQSRELFLLSSVNQKLSVNSLSGMSRLAISLLFTIFLCFVLTSHLSSGRDIFHQFQDEIKDAILHNQDETENGKTMSEIIHTLVIHLLSTMQQYVQRPAEML